MHHHHHHIDQWLAWQMQHGHNHHFGHDRRHRHGRRHHHPWRHHSVHGTGQASEQGQRVQNNHLIKQNRSRGDLRAQMADNNHLVGSEQLQAAQQLARQNNAAVFDYKLKEIVLPDGSHFQAHSGKGAARDNAVAESFQAHGPIPEGRWNVASSQPHSFRLIGGRVDTTPALALSPQAGTQTYGRGGFYVHHNHPGGGYDGLGCVKLAHQDASAVIHARNEGRFSTLIATRDSSLNLAANGQSFSRKHAAVVNGAAFS